MRLITLFLVLSSLALAEQEPSANSITLSPDELKKQARQLEETKGFVKTADDYEAQTQQANKVMEKLKGMTGAPAAPPPARAQASAADSACSSIDSFSKFKDCLGELMNQFNGTPDIAKELPVDPNRSSVGNPLQSH